MTLATELGVDVENVITERWGLEGNRRGDEFDFLCPVHGERKIGSCSINLNSGLWKCLACGVTGDVIKLGMLLTKESYDNIKASLEPSTPEALMATVRGKLEALGRRKRREVPAVLPQYRNRSPLDSMLELGFTQDTLDKWGVRYVVTDVLQGKSGTFTVNDSVAIPIRDATSRLLSWCYRRTDRSPTWQPRYMYTPNVSLSELWFGLQHHTDVSSIVIVEGARDAMWCDQAGIPALALLGSEMGRRKILHLSRYNSVVLFADMDAAGAHAVQRIGGMLGDRTSVRVVTYPQRIVSIYEGKVDPGVLSPVDLELLVAEATPWTSWLTRSA